MKNRYLKESFSHAIHGLYQAFKTERNIKLHCLFGGMVFLLAIVIGLDFIEWALIIIAIAMVLITELLNTAIEYTVDLVCGDTYNELAKYSKDIAAGATLIAAVFAIGIGAVVFLPKVWLLIR